MMLVHNFITKIAHNFMQMRFCGEGKMFCRQKFSPTEAEADAVIKLLKVEL